MFEWMRHTDNTLNSRLKDDVYADDVPGEAEKLIVEFHQYEALLRSIEDKVHSLRSSGKGEAAKRLEQQLIILRVNSMRKNGANSILMIFLESICAIAKQISTISKTVGFRTEICENASNSSGSRAKHAYTGSSFG